MRSRSHTHISRLCSCTLPTAHARARTRSHLLQQLFAQVVKAERARGRAAIQGVVAGGIAAGSAGVGAAR